MQKKIPQKGRKGTPERRLEGKTSTGEFDSKIREDAVDPWKWKFCRG